MKIFVAAAVLALFVVGCEKKEEPKTAYPFPQGTVQSFDEVKILQEAVEKDPGNVDGWIHLGNALMDSSRFGGAIEAYRKALELDPNNVNVRVDMGICYRNTGRSAVAVDEFRKSIEIDPDHLNAHKNLAIVLAYDTGEYSEAVKEFEKAVELAPDAPDAERIKLEIKRLKSLEAKK
jgi:cytochrome c-type biogenesis protein CcmH/NrfG